MAARSAPVHIRLIATRLNRDRADRDLLREFAQHRSQPAFAELVRRYGAMVFGVCRRALRHDHDAEDAFQATFLVLARRAARISTPEKLPGWLHRVAVRTSTEIRHMRDRRQLVNPDRQGGGGLNPDRDGGDDVLEQRELAAALDAELAALPDHYRLPVVLCELRGMSRKQAADELSIAEGTLSSRLAKARKLLAERLTRRGFAASLAVVTATLANTASARIPERLTLLVIESAVGARGTVIAPTVTLATDTVVKALFATKLKGGVLAGALLLAMAGGTLCVPGGAGAQPGGDRPARTAEKTDPAEAWVKQLGSKDFVERETAEKKLRELGAKALPAVKAGLASDVPEIAERCSKVFPTLQAAWLARPESELWKRFAKVAGEDKPARELFTEMVGDTRRAEILQAAEAKPDTAAKQYRDELNRAIKAMREGYDEAERRNRGLTGLNHPASGIPTRGELVALFFLGSFPSTADVKPDAGDRWQDGLHANLFSYGLTPPSGDRKELTEPMRKLLAAWLAVRRDPQMIQHGFGLVKSHGVREALPVARAVAADKTYATKERAAALLAVGMFGNATDMKLVEPLFDCTDEFHSTNYTYPGGQKVSLVTQVRDAAYGVAVKLNGGEPIDHGFELCVEYKTRGNQVFQTSYSLGFRSDEVRTKAHEQVKAFLKTAPIPKAKAVLPKKLDKVPEPSPELRKELFLFDKNYRHGTPEKFAELEKKADELAEQYPEKDDQARIWFEVAHVAAQSDIRKHTDRVEKYAAKCLEISRDPLHRGTLYSYLASAEEVGNGAFADRRKKAADWLLTGYLELLAQELPDQAPELPGVGRFDVDGPGAAQARAQHAAQMASREQAKFVRDQVERRDILALQLRGLFKSDPDELKALAAKKLPGDAAVTELMKRVMKK